MISRDQLVDDLTRAHHSSSYLAEVVSVDDPDGLSRVEVRLLSYDGVEDQSAPIFARVAVPFAGGDRGSFFIPDVGDEVLVTFANGDPRFPIVIGSLWNGSDTPPEQLGGNRVDRWTIVGKAGTRIAIVEESDPTITLTTPGGAEVEITDAGGGKIEFRAAGNTITSDPGGVVVESASKVSITASQVEVSAGMVRVDAAISSFSGIVKCDTLIATTVVAGKYTPGEGNVW